MHAWTVSRGATAVATAVAIAVAPGRQVLGNLSRVLTGMHGLDVLNLIVPAARHTATTWRAWGGGTGAMRQRTSRPGCAPCTICACVLWWWYLEKNNSDKGAAL